MSSFQVSQAYSFNLVFLFVLCSGFLIFIVLTLLFHNSFIIIKLSDFSIFFDKMNKLRTFSLILENETKKVTCQDSNQSEDLRLTAIYF